MAFKLFENFGKSESLELKKSVWVYSFNDQFCWRWIISTKTSTRDSTHMKLKTFSRIALVAALPLAMAAVQAQAKEMAIATILP
ncbi:MAG: hypothetical protein MH219_06050 [Marinobacter sp.]|nr:hypothetical protein [Marinobacter sp.]